MTLVGKVNSIPQYQPITLNSIPNNVRRLNFKSENDSFTKQNTPVYTQPPMLEQQVAMRNNFLREHKKEKTKQNISWALGIAVSIAFLTVLLPQIFKSSGSKPINNTENNIKRNVDELRDLLFKPISEDMNKSDGIATPPRLRKYFSELLQSRNSDNEVIEFIGPLAERIPKRGVIYGGAGVGKTYGIKSFAKDIGAEYCERDFSRVSSKYVGETSVFITKDFINAKNIAMENPDKSFVLVYNEVDALMPDPSKISSESQHLIQNRTAFLDGLDSIKDVPNLYVFATTNFNPANGGLDKTSLQRLGRVIEAELPTAEALEECLNYYLKSLNEDCKVAEDHMVKIREFAEKLAEEKRTHRDVENIIKDAVMKFKNQLTENKKANPTNWKQRFTVEYLEKALNDLGISVNNIDTAGF